VVEEEEHDQGLSYPTCVFQGQRSASSCLVIVVDERIRGKGRTYIGTDALPDSENECWCRITASRSRDSSLSTDGILEAL
jgi:hypothetical protein